MLKKAEEIQKSVIIIRKAVSIEKKLRTIPETEENEGLFARFIKQNSSEIEFKGFSNDNFCSSSEFLDEIKEKLIKKTQEKIEENIEKTKEKIIEKPKKTKENSHLNKRFETLISSLRNSSPRKKIAEISLKKPSSLRISYNPSKNP